MGVVYKALDPRVGRQVALKLLPESLAQDADRRRRFEQEARLAASLNHPNVMAIYDVGLDRHPPYIVAELVPGESLRALIARGPIAPRKAIDIAAQIAAGLAAAHAAGIVHRDLKPENVIVTPDGTAKILDFGVARLDSKAAPAGNATVTLATALGAVVGTAAYMSPEQARAQDVDYRSDQFALGLVLHEMLTGKGAFERPSAVQTMSAIVEDDPPPIESALPSQLRWVLERCLAKEREARYESTRDLARDLAQLRDHYGDFSASQSRPQPAVSAPRRRKQLWAVAASMAAAVAAWCAAQILRDDRLIDLSRYRLTPFATALPAQGLPAWSPDGKSIAFFGATEAGPTQIYVQALDAPAATAITTAITTGDATSVHSWLRPFWAPDSHSVYFLCGKGGEDGLCRVPAGGGEAVMLHANVHSASFAPDGRTLAMLAEAPGEGLRLRLMTASPPEAPPRLYEPQPFQPGIHYNSPEITFSPDGKQILVAIALEGRGETVLLAPWPPGKAHAVFARGLPFAFTPQFSWMPDARYAVFSDPTATYHSRIYMTDTRSGRYWPVFLEDRPAAAPSVSPDGSRVAYESGLSHADLMAVPVGDGPVRTLMGTSRTEQMADASPVGQQLVYVTDRRGVQEVWISSLAEGWDRPLFTPENFQVDGYPAQLFLGPVFSPDGRRVAVAAKGGSRIRIYTAFVSGGAPVRATSGDADLEAAPAWSPDGGWIAFTRVVGNSSKLSKVRPGSGEPPVDLGSLDYSSVPAWSPTGEWIVMHGNGNGNGKLILFSPDGKPSRALPGDEGPVAWSRDGKIVYQVRMSPPALFSIDIASGREQKLRDLAGLIPYAALNPGLNASLTSDGKSIVYTVDRQRREIWILDGIQEPRPWYARLLGK